LKLEKTALQDRQILRKAGWIIAVLVFLVAMGASIGAANLREFSNLYIKIDQDRGLFFVDEADIARAINDYSNGELQGIPLKKLDFTEIEELLESNPFIEKAEVYSSAKGVIDVEIEQREPLVRVVNNSGVSYYLDVNGFKIPTSSKFTPRLVVATGSIESTGDSAVLGQLIRLCRFISSNEFWKAQFEQINVNHMGEFELVPKIGNHIIMIGKTEDLENKFNKLTIFYKEVLKNFDGDNFRMVNLKYKDQIICTKNTL
jgi:cell division protein FtsQ